MENETGIYKMSELTKKDEELTEKLKNDDAFRHAWSKDRMIELGLRIERYLSESDETAWRDHQLAMIAGRAKEYAEKVVGDLKHYIEMQ